MAKHKGGYIAATPIDAGKLGKFAEGDPVDLPAELMPQLIASRSVVEPAREPEPPQLTLSEAIAKLLADDPEKANVDLWTGDGKPDTFVLTQMTGERVSAADRDAAWAAATAQAG